MISRLGGHIKTPGNGTAVAPHSQDTPGLLGGGAAERGSGVEAVHVGVAGAGRDEPLAIVGGRRGGLAGAGGGGGARRGRRGGGPEARLHHAGHGAPGVGVHVAGAVHHEVPAAQHVVLAGGDEARVVEREREDADARGDGVAHAPGGELHRGDAAVVAARDEQAELGVQPDGVHQVGVLPQDLSRGRRGGGGGPAQVKEALVEGELLCDDG
mmetsp:Transcript_21988/g.57312  ORF Transcript_21988/g.57312 Transcript_21988/m.57312 type:complete len:212 (+) Transcript_21988:136-771(+)